MEPSGQDFRVDLSKDTFLMEYWKASVSTLQGTQLKVAGLPAAVLDGSTY